MAVARPRMTEEEFLRLPDDGRKYELVDGEIREVPATFEYDAIGGNIIALLMPAARGRGVLASSQAGFRMTNGNIRCPDVSFTQKSRLPDGKPNKGFGDAAPDLCIEIISPSEDRKDIQRKIREYFDAGAELVWHLFPETREAIVYTSPTQSKTLAPEDEIDAGDLLPGFRCTVGDLFDVGP